MRPAIVAAASTIAGRKIKRPDKKSTVDTEWQTEIWKFYDEVGELHFGLRWKAQACSRLKIVAAHAGDNPEPVVIREDPENPDANEDVLAVTIAEQLAGGAHERSKLLRHAALHIDAVGETWIVVYAETGEAKAYAPSEVKEQQGSWVVAGKTLTEDDLIINPRVPHPSDCNRVDSPIRAARPVLRELHGLNQQLLGAIDSRLAGAGLLVVPQSVSPPKKPATPDDASTEPDEAEQQDPFLMALIEAMMTSISDRESAAAVVPLVVRIPDEAVGKIQHIIFAQPFDPELRALRDEAIRRLSLEMDMPPEILLGTSDVNHWGQWAIDENAIKVNIIPTAQVIVDEFVEEWYRPALEDAGLADPTRYTLLIDAGELEQRADKSGNAVLAYDRGELTGDALRRETGFGDEDKPDDAERTRIIELHAALTGQEAPASSEGQPGVDETRALPELPEAAAPSDEVPPLPAASAAQQLPPEARMRSLTDAAHVAVLRALELAGKRFVAQNRNLRGSSTPDWRVHTMHAMPTDKFDFLLKGAWEAFGTIASPCLVEAIDSYTRDLLTTATEHHRDNLTSVMDLALMDGCDA